MNFLNIFTGNAEWFGRDVGDISIQQKRGINLRSEDFLGEVSTERSDTISQECRVERYIDRLQRDCSISTFKLNWTFCSLLARVRGTGFRQFPIIVA